MEQEERKQARLWRRDLLVIQGGSRNEMCCSGLNKVVVRT